MLELMFGILLPAVGSALIFSCGASTGGTDIVAMIIKKHTRLNISKSLFISDFLIVTLSFVAFGIDTWLFSVFGFAVKVFFVNTVLEGINTSKYCTVIASEEHEEQIADFITGTLHKSATVSESYFGAYHRDRKVVFLTALTRRQTVLLKTYLRSIDPSIFIVVVVTGEIIGKGFRETI